MAKSKAPSKPASAADAPRKQKKIKVAEAEHAIPKELLDSVHRFLEVNEFNGAASALRAHKHKRPSLDYKTYVGSAAHLPSLLEIWLQWQKDHGQAVPSATKATAAPVTNGHTASDDDDDDDDSDASDSSASDADSSDASDAEAMSVDSDSDSDSTDDSEASSSESDAAKPQVKSVKAGKGPAAPASATDSDADTDSSASSESDSDEAAATLKTAKKTALPESDDDSASTASSDSDDASASSSSDDEATQPAKQVEAPAQKKRKLSDAAAAAPNGAADANGTPAKRSKQEQERFSRIPKDTVVDARFASNKYVSYDYADRAHQNLIVTKGKGFTKAKNKGKRGSYRGGTIDIAGKRGIKFDD